ncbi:fimbria/pilus outer membrane usher protein [Brevundimonas sp.]|uniref:fimbria/pilus outer membrane usher protein n=1 Tax=Brevundimonas sp. TaxID=1871086 RepID=UPI002899DEBB|nr:fimbria/pilus outer membrane usher protein [Brevundimonas sp.]
MSVHRMTAGGRGAYLGCSHAVLMMTIFLAGTASAATATENNDPDAPIVTNRHSDGSVSSGGPELDAALSGSPSGVPAEAGVSLARSRPRTAAAAPITGTPARITEDVDEDAVAVPAAPPVVQQTAPIGTARVYTSIDVPLTLNGRFLGMVSADVDRQGSGLVDARRFFDLVEPVITPETLTTLRQAAAGRERVPFADLDIAGFTLVFSTTALELQASAGGNSLNATQMSLSGNRVPPDPADFPQPARFSAGANISIADRYLHDDGETAPFRGAIDGIVHWGGFGGVTLITGAEYDGSREGSGWRRTETRLVKDFFKSGIRAMAGEFTPIADGFQGSGRVVGFGVERAYSAVRPFQNIRPTGRQEFTLERAATVDVIVNGLMSQTLRLEPGRYSVADFPFSTGANQVQLVVDDVTGRREIAVFDVFSGSELLGDGVVDFGVAAGRYEGSIPFEYDGPMLATGFVRKGYGDNLTLGVNAQASKDVQQIGGSAIWGSRFGLLMLEMAASRDRLRDGTGVAASLSYRHSFSIRDPEDLRITATMMGTSSEFVDVFQPDRSNPDVWRFSTLVQWNAPWQLGLSVGFGVAEARLDGFRRHQIDLGVSRSFGRVNLVSNVSFTNAEDEDDVRFSIGLTMPLGGRWNAQARYDSDDSRSELVIGRYSTGSLNDLSGEARFTNDDRTRNISGRLDYIHNRFEAQLTHNRPYDRLRGQSAGVESVLALRSFIGFADGAFALGRPVDDAFIIAPVHKSLADSKVTIMSGSRKVAKSGLLGTPLIPIQRSYGINSFDVLIDPLPTGYDIGSGTINVFPAFGTGYHQQIGSDASRIAVGALVGPEGPLVLGVGQVLAEGADPAEARPFFTNRAGRFVADRLAPGRYRIMIEGREVARFVISEDSEGMVDVGTLQISPR